MYYSPVRHDFRHSTCMSYLHRQHSPCVNIKRYFLYFSSSLLYRFFFQFVPLPTYVWTLLPTYVIYLPTYILSLPFRALLTYSPL